MTRFYIDGKWVELDELIEKADNWDRRTHLNIDLAVKIEKRLESALTYLDELQETGRFFNRVKLKAILEGQKK